MSSLSHGESDDQHDHALLNRATQRLMRARASFGFPPDATVTLRLTVGDFVRFSLGAVSPVALLTEERLKLEGDLAVAAKLVPMFGRFLPQS